MVDRTTVLKESFQCCIFAPAAKQRNDGDKSKDSQHLETPNSITSFFVDSSGRSSFTVPLQMTFQTKKDLDELLDANCFDPPPHNLDAETDANGDGDGDGDGSNKGECDETGVPLPPTIRNFKGSASVAFEVKSSQTDEDVANEVTVEGVSILSCSIKNLVVTFKTKVTVRATASTAALAVDSSSRFTSSPQRTTTMTNSAEAALKPLQREEHNVSTSLQITPVFTIENTSTSQSRNENLFNESSSNNDFNPDFTALELAAIPDQMQSNNKATSGVLSTRNDRSHEVRLSPVIIDVSLTNAFAIAVTGVSGPKGRMGNTLISLTIQHSKTHELPVTITNISVHPGHSRHNVAVARNSASNNKKTNTNKNERSKVQQAVSNMTESVEWGYAPKTELKLPLTLLPHEAYSSVIFINAGEERNSRQFVSPISVTGVIDANANTGEDDLETNVDDSSDDDGRELCRVVVAGDAHWTTKPIAVEPVDAFRIDMSTIGPTVQRGEPMVIKLRIFNLSLESRNLMIFMAKKEQDPLSKNAKEESVNAAIVTECDGYTFGVWGISGDDDGTVRWNRDSELLAVDTALVLGEVQGQHAVHAELRFVPLRLGRLRVPNWKLYDKGANRWYNCIHDLNIIAV